MLSRHAADDIVVGKISEDLQYQTDKLEGKINSLRSALKGSVDSNDVSLFTAHNTISELILGSSMIISNQQIRWPRSLSSTSISTYHTVSAAIILVDRSNWKN
jgi:hypothetical protein